VNREGIGAPLARVEDERFLVGRGRFVADLEIRDTLDCVLVRSPHAHARVRGIDSARARTAPGVVAILTGEDLRADAIGPMRAGWTLRGSDGTAMREPARWPLARDAVRHVGEPVAAVIAASREVAEDAAALVAIEYQPLAAVADAAEALAPQAPRVHPEGNLCFRWQRGDAAKVQAAFARAARVVDVELRNNRLCGAALETRAVLAVPEARAGACTLYCSTQTPHHVRHFVAEELGIPEGWLRVVSPDVGGGFGYKGKHYPEETLLAWAARRLGRPVRWIAERTESFVSDTQGRDHVTRAELALSAEGEFLGLRVRTIANLGAYVSTFGAAIAGPIYSALLAGVYRTPAIHVEVLGAFTNTVPTDAYRGAGRPEACYVLERLADRAARALGLDRAELRRRNFIARQAMPYTTPVGPIYDCGDFRNVFDRVLEMADSAGFETRRAKSARRGLLRGLGVASFVESSGVAPSKLAGMLGAKGGFFEAAEIRVRPDGSVQALLGTHSHGQGHATTFAQILASRFGVPVASIEIVEGDTAAVPHGTGTFGSRSIAVGGSALHRAAEKVLAKGARIAAHMLEADARDLAYRAGAWEVQGTDRRVAFAEVARRAHAAHALPAGEEPGWQDAAFYDPPNFAFSNGAHACEVEVDPDTGAVRLAGYWVVDDVGTVINPVIVEGQVHGGLAQGIGQALLECAVYEAEGAQPVAASFMDYALPRAADLPRFACATDESQPCTHNPLGAKGCGESGAIGAPAAVMSALLDALAPLGVDDLEMPATPERVWRAIIRARGGQQP
jgi:carbon-monoxide dehydrogenase large subunit